MLATMSSRERTLALLVGGVLFLLINLVLIRFFMQKRAEFMQGIASSQAKIAGLKKREADRAMWAERDAWTRQSLPVLGDPQVANRELGEAVKEIAKKHTVTLETPNPGVPSRQKEYTALGIRVSLKAPWTPLMDFLRELQAPGQFIVFDPLDLKVDPTDKTQLRAEVTVTKWFAPQ